MTINLKLEKTSPFCMYAVDWKYQNNFDKYFAKKLDNLHMCVC